MLSKKKNILIKTITTQQKKVVLCNIKIIWAQTSNSFKILKWAYFYFDNLLRKKLL